MKSNAVFPAFIFFVLGSIAVLLYACCVEPHWLRVANVTYTHGDIPSSFIGKKILFLSDVHRGKWFSHARLRNLVETVNQQNPDIVILGGDILDNDETLVQETFQELRGIQSSLGTFAILGNHDYYANNELIVKNMLDNGIQPLVNEGAWVVSPTNPRERLRIGGVDDLWMSQQDTSSIIQGVEESDFFILVAHNPDSIEYIDISFIDLVLSGHTHGGQVALFGFAPLLPSEYGQTYRYGFLRKVTTDVYVTSGVGTLLPIRLFVRPEIVVLTMSSD